MLDPIDTQESQGTFDDGVVYQIPQSQIKTPVSHVSSRSSQDAAAIPTTKPVKEWHPPELPHARADVLQVCQITDPHEEFAERHLPG